MKHIFFITSITLPLAVLSQTASTKKADKDYGYYNYSGVVDKLAGKEATLNTDALRKLADSYKMAGDFTKAEETYAKVVTMSDKTNEDVYNYAQVLKSNQKYKESTEQLKIYAEANAEEKRVKLFNADKNYFTDLLVDKKQFEIKNLDINSPQQDFGATYYKNQMVYASSKQKVGSVFRRWNGNDLPYLDLYQGNENANHDQITDAKRMSTVNKKYHEGPAAYTKDGNWVMFTRDNYKEKSSDGVRKLEMVEAKMENGKWGKEMPFPLNNKEYSMGHPSYSNDGNTLYFASDMPGGKGGVDIYKIKRVSGGTWTTPENLENINTEGDEMFPFVHNDNVLFFSSNGHPGLGGLDVFATQVNEKGAYGKVMNLGTPLNGSKDDFTFVLNDDKTKGYFASNREGGKGNDDIYSFNLLKPLEFCKSIKGTAKDKEGNIVPLAKISLKNAKGSVLDTVRAAEDGTYAFCVDDAQVYKLQGAKQKYYDGNNTANVTEKSDVVISDVILEKDPGLGLLVKVKDGANKQPLEGVTVILVDMSDKSFDDFETNNEGKHLSPLQKNKVGDHITYKLKYEKKGYLTKETMFNYDINKPEVIEVNETLDKLAVGGDLAKMIDIKPIFFDLNKFNIRPDAAVELNKIVKVMNDYPGMVVELGSHTDCRASYKYNETLSDKRAKASAAYIKKSISKPDRIYGKGYGEAKLKNGCACEGTVKSTCTEDEHQANRRTEFIIIKLD